jgi:hypothetical protein
MRTTRCFLGRVLVQLGVVGSLIGAMLTACLAQTENPPLIKVESREVVLPVTVIRETKAPGAAAGPRNIINLPSTREARHGLLDICR